MAAFIPKMLLSISLIAILFMAHSMASEFQAAAPIADDSSEAADDLMATNVDKRIPYPSGWRQPGRVRSFHALEMPDFNRGRFNRFFDYAQRPLFVRYMRSFAAPGATNV